MCVLPGTYPSSTEKKKKWDVMCDVRDVARCEWCETWVMWWDAVVLQLRNSEVSQQNFLRSLNRDLLYVMTAAVPTSISPAVHQGLSSFSKTSKAAEEIIWTSGIFATSKNHHLKHCAASHCGTSWYQEKMYHEVKEITFKSSRFVRIARIVKQLLRVECRVFLGSSVLVLNL